MARILLLMRPAQERLAAAVQLRVAIGGDGNSNWEQHILDENVAYRGLVHVYNWCARGCCNPSCLDNGGNKVAISC